MKKDGTYMQNFAIFVETSFFFSAIVTYTTNSYRVGMFNLEKKN